MILREQEEEQQPKLRDDRALLPTRRYGSSSNHDPEAQRPTSPAPTVLPDYETSQAQFYSGILTSVQKSTKSFARSRCFRILWWALIVYAVIVGLIVVPIVAWKLTHKGGHGGGDDGGGKPLILSIPFHSATQVDMALLASENATFECNKWSDKHTLTPTPDDPFHYSASLSFTFPPLPVLQLSSDGYLNWTSALGLSGLMTFDVNPDASQRDLVLSAEVRYIRPDLFHGLSICHTQTSNTSVIGLRLPPNLWKEDILETNMTLLFPQREEPISIATFATCFPSYKQVFGALSSAVHFNEVVIEGSGAPVSFDGIHAQTLAVRTSNSSVMGRFNVSQVLSIDTVNGPIEADIFLSNDASCKAPTHCSLNTGNAPIVADIVVSDQCTSTHQHHPHFEIHPNTFNAGLNMSISHASGSQPSKLWSMARTTQGPIHCSLDTLYTGTFDLSTKDASADVLRVPASAQDAASMVNVLARWFTGGWNVVPDYGAPGRMLGWVGYGKRPADGHGMSHISLTTSLSPVTLSLDEPVS
ncbi:hypothetical protein PENSPDRAFT_750237 [Peniophora sp. CONT]|nr:hypothetical protein PENSPDRAFT_750237 [Peniophora sp. CONT]